MIDLSEVFARLPRPSIKEVRAQQEQARERDQQEQLEREAYQHAKPRIIAQILPLLLTVLTLLVSFIGGAQQGRGSVSIFGANLSSSPGAHSVAVPILGYQVGQGSVSSPVREVSTFIGEAQPGRGSVSIAGANLSTCPSAYISIVAAPIPDYQAGRGSVSSPARVSTHDLGLHCLGYGLTVTPNPSDYASYFIVLCIVLHRTMHRTKAKPN